MSTQNYLNVNNSVIDGQNHIIDDVKIEEISPEDLKNIDSNNFKSHSEDETFQNHSQRRRSARNYMRQNKIPVKVDGKLTGYTSQLRENMHKESVFSVWFDRITKSHEYGKEVHKRNTERNYRYSNELIKEIQNKKFELLTNIYGKDEAQVLLDKQQERIHNRNMRILNKRKLKKL